MSGSRVARDDRRRDVMREDGKLLTNWVERASWEQFQRLKD